LILKYSNIKKDINIFYILNYKVRKG